MKANILPCKRRNEDIPLSRDTPSQQKMSHEPQWAIMRVCLTVIPWSILGFDGCSGAMHGFAHLSEGDS